jgi:hypothetical protein
MRIECKASELHDRIDAAWQELSDKAKDVKALLRIEEAKDVREFGVGGEVSAECLDIGLILGILAEVQMAREEN